MVKLETNLYVAKGYDGPVLPCNSETDLNICARTVYEYTMRFKVPEGLKTSRGVLRWHYLTTNSCTWTGADDEEFWNCADIAISDTNGDVGPDLPYNNDALEALKVEDLKDSTDLRGLYDACLLKSAWAVMGVGTPDEYKGQCGDFEGGRYERCGRLS